MIPTSCILLFIILDEKLTKINITPIHKNIATNSNIGIKNLIIQGMLMLLWNVRLMVHTS